MLSFIKTWVDAKVHVARMEKENPEESRRLGHEVLRLEEEVFERFNRGLDPGDRIKILPMVFNYLQICKPSRVVLAAYGDTEYCRQHVNNLQEFIDMLVTRKKD